MKERDLALDHSEKARIEEVALRPDGIVHTAKRPRPPGTSWIEDPPPSPPDSRYDDFGRAYQAAARIIVRERGTITSFSSAESSAPGLKDRARSAPVDMYSEIV